MSEPEIYVTFDLWMTLIFDLPETDSLQSKMRYEGFQRILMGSGFEISAYEMERAYDESATKLDENWKKGIELSTDDQNYSQPNLTKCRCPNV